MDAQPEPEPARRGHEHNRDGAGYLGDRIGCAVIDRKRDGVRGPWCWWDPFGLALLLLWMAAQWFPFMPQIRRAVIAEALLRIAVPGPWPEAAESPASLLLISYLLRARIEIRHWRPILAAAATMLTLRFAWNGGYGDRRPSGPEHGREWLGRRIYSETPDGALS